MASFAIHEQLQLYPYNTFFMTKNENSLVFHGKYHLSVLFWATKLKNTQADC